MLPDFLPVKRRISKILISYLREKVKNSDPFIRQLRRRIQHEGSGQIMKTYDGNIDKIEYQSIGSEFKIQTEEIIREGIFAFIKHINKLANDILGQQSKMVFQKLNEITSKTGNVVDSRGEPFTPEKLLEALDKIEMEFDESGQPTNLTIVMHPDLWNRIKDKIPVWEADSGFKKKHNAIIEKKRKEWLDRENNRKLVD